MISEKKGSNDPKEKEPLKGKERKLENQNNQNGDKKNQPKIVDSELD